jgi:hypothetical protein
MMISAYRFTRAFNFGLGRHMVEWTGTARAIERERLDIHPPAAQFKHHAGIRGLVSAVNSGSRFIKRASLTDF